MTMLLSPITTFTTPMSGTLHRISHALSHYHATRAQKARVAKHLKMLATLDTHMLNDVGMKDFNRLAPEQQERVLLDTLKQG